MINKKMILRIRRTEEKLYQLAFAVYIVLSYLFNNSIAFISELWSNNNQIYLYVGVGIIAILLIIKVIRNLTTEDLKKIIPLLIGAIVSYIFSNTIFMFVLLLFLLSGKDINMDGIIRTTLYTKCLCLLFILYLHFNGITFDYVQNKNGIAISALGFKNVNILAAVIFEINMMLLYLYRKKAKWISVVMYMIVSIICFYITRSRTPFFVSLAVFFLNVFYNIFKDKIKNIKKILGRIIICFIVVGVGILFILLVFNLEFFENRGEWLSYRFHLIYSFMKQYGITLLGQELVTVSGRTLDVGYIYILIAYGIIGFLFFVILHILALKNAIKQKDAIEMFIILGFMLYGLGETYIFRIEFNFSLFLLIPIIWSKHNKNIINENLMEYG